MQGLTNSCIMQPSSKVTYKNRLLVAKSPATRFVKNSPTWTTFVSKSGARDIIPPRIAQSGLLHRVAAWTARSDGRQTDIRHHLTLALGQTLPAGHRDSLLPRSYHPGYQLKPCKGAFSFCQKLFLYIFHLGGSSIFSGGNILHRASFQQNSRGIFLAKACNILRHPRP